MSAHQQLQQLNQQRQAVASQIAEVEGRLSSINQRIAAIDSKLRERAYSAELAKAGLAEALAAGSQPQIDDATAVAVQAAKDQDRHRLEQEVLALEAQALRSAAQQLTDQAQPLANQLMALSEQERAIAQARLHEVAGDLPKELAAAADAIIRVHAKAMALNQISAQLGGGGSYGPDIMPTMVIRQLGPGWMNAQPIPFSLSEAANSERSALLTELKREGFKVA